MRVPRGALNDEASRTFTISLPGPLLQSGFWLYVWRIDVGDGREVLYVGRTGDSSSPNASPPYKRFGQHLSFQQAGNVI